MPRLIANTALRYAARDMKAGDEFDATDKDAFVLKTTGKANDVRGVTPAAPPAEQSTQTAKTEIELFGNQSGKRGRHNRRDMRAQD